MSLRTCMACHTGPLLVTLTINLSKEKNVSPTGRIEISVCLLMVY